MRAFIIRPFGTRKGIDFDAVEHDLLARALDQLDVSGRTTLDILRQGNIRLDMFQRLVTADLVIADVSIHNANVFYELGIRHALQDKRTFLVRCHRAGATPDDVPFDIRTERYLSYEKDNPAASLEALVAALRQTINTDLRDSPVFGLLPELQVQDRSRFLPVPIDFREEVDRAAQSGESGDLSLLASEAAGFEWEIEGLRVVARAQTSLKAYDEARLTWEAVRTPDGNDIEANTLLGTIYQRLGDLVRSDQALRRVLDQRGIGKGTRAELQALLGRNAKTRWAESWRDASAGERPRAALQSPHLEQSLDAYERAFHEDLNHFYSGLNALAMLTVRLELARAQDDVWTSGFETADEGQRQLQAYEDRRRTLCSAVEISLDAETARLTHERKRDVWVEISKADLRLLTSRKPLVVGKAYREALAGAPDFAVDSARTQLQMYEQLGILADTVAAALSAFPPPATGAERRGTGRVLLFTGHMIDAPTRLAPRFPPDPANVEAAKQAIRAAVLSEQQSSAIAYGMAGAACGGDILFHQVCEELGIPTRVFLAIPRDRYIVSSVAHAGPEWVEKFNAITVKGPVRVLADSEALPRWLQEKPNYTIWQRNNLWVLFNALTAGSANMTLIALWDGQAGDGPGGTADMVDKAHARGARTILLDTKKIFAGR